MPTDALITVEGVLYSPRARMQRRIHSSFKPFDVYDVQSALLKIDVKKTSTRADSLDPFLLQLSAPVIAESLTYMFYLTIVSGVILKIWKTAQVLSVSRLYHIRP